MRTPLLQGAPVRLLRAINFTYFSGKREPERLATRAWGMSGDRSEFKNRTEQKRGARRVNTELRCARRAPRRARPARRSFPFRFVRSRRVPSRRGAFRPRRLCFMNCLWFGAYTRRRAPARRASPPKQGRAATTSTAVRPGCGVRRRPIRSACGPPCRRPRSRPAPCRPRSPRPCVRAIASERGRDAQMVAS